MRKLIIAFALCACVATASVFADAMDVFGMNGRTSPSNGASKSAPASAVMKERENFSVGIDGGWRSAGALVRYRLSDAFSVFGKIGYDYGDGLAGPFKGRNPFLLHFEGAAYYAIPVTADIDVGPTLGVTFLAAKPLGISPEIGAVGEYSPKSVPISIFLRLMYAPAFFFNVDANTAVDSHLVRGSFTLGFTYNFDI